VTINGTGNNFQLANQVFLVKVTPAERDLLSAQRHLPAFGYY
jgi:hypothetical protein